MSKEAVLIDDSIGDLGEFGLIARLTGRLPVGESIELGPGDDAAVVRAPGGRVVATTDLLVEGRHFRRDWSGPYEVGRKAAAQNLADVVAMGARPSALLIGFGAPPETGVAWAEALFDGLRDECALVGASVAGGDTVRAPLVVLAITALGDLIGERPLTRDGALPGDTVAVRGRLGWAAAGLELLEKGLDGPVELIEAHRHPEPPYAAGEEAVRLRARALMDVSDGLVQDLGHIAEAGGVGIELEGSRLRPLGPAEGGSLHHVLTGGDDHAFVATFPPEVVLPGSWRQVGRVVGGSGVMVDGLPYGLGGWDHFRR